MTLVGPGRKCEKRSSPFPKKGRHEPATNTAPRPKASQPESGTCLAVEIEHSSGEEGRSKRDESEDKARRKREWAERSNGVICRAPTGDHYLEKPYATGKSDHEVATVKELEGSQPHEDQVAADLGKQCPHQLFQKKALPYGVVPMLN